MKPDSKPSKRNEVIALPVLQDDKFMKLEEHLLPGISNDVTLGVIATKLPWRTLLTLSSVGTAWRQAMQDRLVYDARVRAHSGDSFVIISDSYSTPYISKPAAISHYSLRHKTCYRLPPIPQVESGFPYDSECIALDGKVYILDGSKERSGQVQLLGSKEVYVLDLAGQRQWKPCAKMRKARANFTCGAKDEKIYVFGGTCGKRWAFGSEVYDPSVDAWSTIASMPSGPPRYPSVNALQVAYLRECWRLNNAVGTVEELLLVLGTDYKLRGYCPVTDTWRALFDKTQLDMHNTHHREFMAHGKLHSMSLTNIRVYDVEKNEWIEFHSCSFAAVTVPGQLLDGPISVLAVDTEILAIIEQRSVETGVWSTHLVQSKGFGSEDKNIVWEELPFSLFLWNTCPSMCLLKL